MSQFNKRSLTDFCDKPNIKRQNVHEQPDIFRIKHTQEYDKDFPIYKQPQELTSYSIDGKRHVWFDNREMKYYYPPSSNSRKDLNVGYDEFIKRDESVSEHLDTLLDALSDLQEKQQQQSNEADEESTAANIITWRGIITKILCTPYCRKDAWELRATRYKGSIYMEEVANKQNESSRQQLMSYWGYRFETLCTVSKPPGDIKREKEPELTNRLTASANTNIQYCIVVKTKLGNTSLIMGAEVDCCRDVKPTDPLLQPSNYIELKTSRIIESEKNQFSFERYKLLKFWAQSFLVGVPRVMCGFRDDDGNIIEIKQFKTLEIPRIVREKKNLWKPAVCLNFANDLLDWIKKSVIIDDATFTYSICYNGNGEIKLSSSSNVNHVFLTQRYLDGTTQHEIGGPRAGFNTAGSAGSAGSSVQQQSQ